MRNESTRQAGTRAGEDDLARTTASDLKAVADDMLRMGRHWARAAQGWMERVGGSAHGQAYSRSDRDLQSDYGSDGYDQVDAGRPSHDARGGSMYGSGAYEYTGRDYDGRDYGGRDYRGVGPSNYTRSDERIREDLNERLTEAHDLDASGLSVAVENGVATLDGRVPQRWMKHRAEDIADACTGVSDVRNRILVGDASATTSASGNTRVGTTAGHAGAPGKETP